MEPARVVTGGRSWPGRSLWPRPGSGSLQATQRRAIVLMGSRRHALRRHPAAWPLAPTTPSTSRSDTQALIDKVKKAIIARDAGAGAAAPAPAPPRSSAAASARFPAPGALAGRPPWRSLFSNSAPPAHGLTAGRPSRVHHAAHPHPQPLIGRPRSAPGPVAPAPGRCPWGVPPGPLAHLMARALRHARSSKAAPVARCRLRRVRRRRRFPPRSPTGPPPRPPAHAPPAAAAKFLLLQPSTATSRASWGIWACLPRRADAVLALSREVVERAVCGGRPAAE